MARTPLTTPTQGNTSWWNWANQVGTEVESVMRGINTYNVKNYGAKGDGSTDDSAAIQATVSALLSERVYLGEALAAQKSLYFPAGTYRVTQADILLASPTTGTADPIHGYRVIGDGPRVTEVFFDSSFSVSSDPRANNLITAANRLHYAEFRDISFRSSNAANNWGFFWSVWMTDGTSVYPNYGSGQNHHFVFRNVEWRGSWNRVIGVDGDAYANNNSEWSFDNCETYVDFTAVDAFLNVGITNPDANNQQDQFVNWFFSRCNFALSGGTLLKYGRGGNITIRDGSWSFVGNNPGTYLSFPRSVDKSCMNLVVEGVRFEPKASDGTQKIIDCRWGVGNVTFRNCSDIGSTQSGAFATTPFHQYTNVNGWLPVIRYMDCKLTGVHQFDCGGSNPSSRGKAIYEGCEMYHNITATAFLKATATGGFPRYKFVDCWTTPDASN